MLHESNTQSRVDLGAAGFLLRHDKKKKKRNLLRQTWVRMFTYAASGINYQAAS